MLKMLCLFAVSCAALCGPGLADTIHVDDDAPNDPGPGDPSVSDPAEDGTMAHPFDAIQEAIDLALSGTDEVVVAPGTYFETIDFLGKAITVRSSDGPDVTTIDAQGSGSVVTCESGEGPDSVLEGLTITGGTGTDVEIFPSSVGGGMFNDNSNPTVTNCTFSGNTALNQGGGMANRNATPTVIDCTFSGNWATSGGGMSNFNTSSPTVTNCTFSGNSATIGGGMSNFNTCSPTVTNCTFSGNSATSGGGMSNVNSSSPTVSNCSFSGNTATSGGGMSNVNSSSPTVTNCVLWSDSPNEMSGPSKPIVTFSDVQGGFPGTGNIDADPLFVDPDNGDFRLSPGSPCIDAGDSTAVPGDITNDLDGNPRFVDAAATADTGNGVCHVDIGAYEFQQGAAVCCPGDLNADGVVNVLDLIQLVMSFGPCEGCSADFDDDGIVNVLDLITLLMNFGPCPGAPCVWDVNGDGIVDQSDVEAVTSNLGPCDGCPEDVNGDGVVNGSDVQAVATHFGPCP